MVVFWFGGVSRFGLGSEVIGDGDGCILCFFFVMVEVVG